MSRFSPPVVAALATAASAVAAFGVSGWSAGGRTLPGMLLVAGFALLLVLRAPTVAVVVLTITGTTVFALPFRPMSLAGFQSDVPEFLVVALLIGLLLGRFVHQRRLHGPYVRPLLLLAAAVAVGLGIGAANGVARATLIGDLKPYLYYSVALAAGTLFATEGRQQLLERLVVWTCVGGCLVVVAQAALGYAVASEADTHLYTLGRVFEVQRFRPPLLNLLPLGILLVTARAVVGRLNLLLGAQLGLLLTVEALGFNRSSWLPIALAVALLLALRPGPRRQWRTLRLVLAGAVLAPSLFVLAGAGVFGPTGTALVIRVGSTVNSKVAQEDSYSDRALEDHSALTTLAGSPVLGVGIGELYGARRAVYRYDLGYYVYVDRSFLHNSYLFAWLQLGLLGLGAFAWLGVQVARTGFRAVLELPWQPATRVLAGCLALLSYGLTAIFQPYLVDKASILSVCLALALAQPPLRNRAPAEPAPADSALTT